jgi:hypothetical protein
MGLRTKISGIMTVTAKINRLSEITYDSVGITRA